MSEEPSKKKRKRFARKTNPTPIRITDADLDIFRWLSKHRILRTRHIMELSGRSRGALNRRLERLYDNKYLDRIDPRKEKDYELNSDHLHVLDTLGALELKRRGERASQYSDAKRKAGRDHVSHSLLIADFIVCVKTACARSVERVRFIPDEEILIGTPRLTQPQPLKVWGKVQDSKGRWKDDFTIADALFGLEFPEVRKRYYYFFEADRGTMPNARVGSEEMSHLKGKYKVYYAYWRSLQKSSTPQDFGFPTFSVLYLTDKGEQRARNANKMSQTIFPNRHSWLFSYKKHLFADPSDILTATWVRGSGEVGSLMGENSLSGTA